MVKQHLLIYWDKYPIDVTRWALYRTLKCFVLKAVGGYLYWPVQSMGPSGPPAQVSILQASRSCCSGFLPSTAPGTDPGGPGWKQRKCFLSARFAGTENSNILTWAPSSAETPAWPLLWKTWRSWSQRTSSDLRGGTHSVSGRFFQRLNIYRTIFFHHH